MSSKPVMLRCGLLRCVGSRLDDQCALRMLKNMHETMKNVTVVTGSRRLKSP